MTASTAPRHAASTPAPYLLPAHYMSADTLDASRYPLVLLTEDYAEVGTPGLPVAQGVRIVDAVDESAHGVECDECGDPVVVYRMQHPEGPDTPACAACATGGDHLGLVPSCYVAFLPVE